MNLLMVVFLAAHLLPASVASSASSVSANNAETSSSAVDVDSHDVKSKRIPLPLELNINGAVWKITMTDWDPRGMAGLTDHEKHTIFIARGQALPDEQDTVLHEILHGLMGHDFTHSHIEGHEAIVRMAPALLRVMKDNPELVKYLEQ